MQPITTFGPSEMAPFGRELAGTNERCVRRYGHIVTGKRRLSGIFSDGAGTARLGQSHDFSAVSGSARTARGYLT
jgi:hypothetical protein